MLQRDFSIESFMNHLKIKQLPISIENLCEEFNKLDMEV
jgi:hypothetical protein